MGQGWAEGQRVYVEPEIPETSANEVDGDGDDTGAEAVLGATL